MPPHTIAESARLNTAKCLGAMKSTTAPSKTPGERKIRSVRLPSAPPSSRPSAIAQGRLYSLRASRAITTITAAAITVKITVKASPKPKAAPALRIASNFSQSPMISIGGWCSSLATTIILLIRSRAYANAATPNSTAIRRRPRGRSAVFPASAVSVVLPSECSGSAPAASGVSGVPMMRSASAT